MASAIEKARESPNDEFGGVEDEETAKLSPSQRAHAPVVNIFPWLLLALCATFLSLGSMGVGYSAGAAIVCEKSGNPIHSGVDKAAATIGACPAAPVDPVDPVLAVGPCAAWPPADGARRFVDIVAANGKLGLSTDKAPNPYFTRWAPHGYDVLYKRYLAPLRGTDVRLLEIGLGCDMPLGVGASVPLWREYLGVCMKYTIMEFDGPCAEKFRKSVDALFIGDQSSLTDLAPVAAAGPYDVIIEDGGHSMKQQITTLRTLLPLQPPGALFFVEDLSTSYLPKYFDMPAGETTVRFLADLAAVLHLPIGTGAVPTGLMDGSAELARLVSSIDCAREICVLVRNAVKA